MAPQYIDQKSDLDNTMKIQITDLTSRFLVNNYCQV